MGNYDPFEHKKFPKVLANLNHARPYRERVFQNVDILGLHYLSYDPNSPMNDLEDAKHSHGMWEIHLIKSGTLCYLVEDTPVEIGQGEFILLEPGVTHHQQFKDAAFSKYSIFFFIPGKTKLTDFFSPLLNTRYLKLKTSDGMTRIISYLFDTINDDAPEGEQMLRCCMELFLLNLTRCIRTWFEGRQGDTVKNMIFDGSDDAVLCVRVIQYVRDNIARILTTEEIAKHFYISGRNLNRKIHTYYGKSLGRITNELRCSYAKDLLACSSLSVAEIACRLGYSNSSNFIHFFQREEGISPAEYRRSADRSENRDQSN